MSRCSPSSIIAIFHTTSLLSLPQNKIRAGKLLIDPGHLQEDRLRGRPHYRYRRARRHRPVVDAKKHNHGQKWPKTMVSLKWRVFKLCCPAHLFPNTPRMLHTLIHFTRSASSYEERFSHLYLFTQIARCDLSTHVGVTNTKRLYQSSLNPLKCTRDIHVGRWVRYQRAT